MSALYGKSFHADLESDALREQRYHESLFEYERSGVDEAVVLDASREHARNIPWDPRVGSYKDGTRVA